MSEAIKYAVEMRGITKRFGEVVANRNLNIAVRDRSIHAIIGENGAGKSTASRASSARRAMPFNWDSAWCISISCWSSP